MAGVRELGDVIDYPVDGNFTADDSGYVLEAKQDGTGEVQHVTGDSTSVIGANFVSTENQQEEIVTPDSGQVDVVSETAGFPLKADADDYYVGESVYLSATNDGHVNKTDTGNYRVGRVVRSTTVDSAGEKVIVKFDTA